MRLTIRPAVPNDVPTLVELYDHAYRGGYSACFDRYGPAAPQDFWWVQSEKPVYLVELDTKPVGLVILGRVGRQMLVEELQLRVPAGGAEREARAKAEDAMLRQLHDFLVTRFQQERQDQLTLRCAETNALALSLSHRFDFTFANALVVAAGATRRQAAVPAGYLIRRGAASDARAIARLQEEALNVKVRSEDLDALWKHAETRVFLAEHEKFPVGLALAQAKDGVGRWTVGVGDAHRRKGIGMALAQQALQFFHDKKLTPITTYWGLDAPASRFVRGLGGKTERAYLYFEKRI